MYLDGVQEVDGLGGHVVHLLQPRVVRLLARHRHIEALVGGVHVDERVRFHRADLQS